MPNVSGGYNLVHMSSDADSCLQQGTPTNSSYQEPPVLIPITPTAADVAGSQSASVQMASKLSQPTLHRREQQILPHKNCSSVSDEAPGCCHPHEIAIEGSAAGASCAYWCGACLAAAIC